MRERWRFIDRGYLSIPFTYESATDIEAIAGPLCVWILDVSIRPIAVLLIAVARAAFLRCRNFAFLFTSPPRICRIDQTFSIQATTVSTPYRMIRLSRFRFIHLDGFALPSDQIRQNDGARNLRSDENGLI